MLVVNSLKNKMNFSFGNFNESIKYSFQQFTRQEEEAREHSRKLLGRLDRFEAKALELELRTKKAMQNKDHYERILMHQYPLLWAHIQRGFLCNTNDSEIEVGNNNFFLYKPTREMAINTSLSSSPTDQNSIQEGVWPSTPSPHPEKKGEKHLSSRKEMGKICDNFNSYEPGLCKANLEVGQSHPHEIKNIIVPKAHNQTLELDICQLGIDHQPSPPTIKGTRENISEIEIGYQVAPYHSQEASCLASNPDDNRLEHKMPSESSANHDNLFGKTVLMPTKELNNLSNPQPEVLVEKHSNSPKLVKETPPFRLDSESDCPDDPISAPSVGYNEGGDDSDSFWNP